LLLLTAWLAIGLWQAYGSWLVQTVQAHVA
jgi:hypothetical protein